MGSSAPITNAPKTVTVTNTTNNAVTEIGSIGLSGDALAALVGELGNTLNQGAAINAQSLAGYVQSQDQALLSLSTMEAASRSLSPDVNLGTGQIQTDTAAVATSPAILLLIGGVILLFLLK